MYLGYILRRKGLENGTFTGQIEDNGKFELMHRNPTARKQKIHCIETRITGKNERKEAMERERDALFMHIPILKHIGVEILELWFLLC